MLCGRSVDTKCKQCGVWSVECVYAVVENHRSTCFRDFHTKPNLLNNESLGAIHGSDEEDEADKEN